MADEPERGRYSIPGDLVEYILLGHVDDRRQLQDSPILGDVWLAYAAAPGEIQDLLISPYRDATAGRVAGDISKRIKKIGRSGKPVQAASIAYLQGIVAARLYFEEVLRILVPLTQWWKERKVRPALEKLDFGELGVRIGAMLDPRVVQTARAQPASIQDNFTSLERYVALAALILWAGDQRARGEPRVEEVLNTFAPHIEAAMRRLGELFRAIRNDHPDEKHEPLIFQVSLNRRPVPALDRSVQAVKADAARTLFNVSCKRITWAVLDAGIDSGHEAFRTRDGSSRIVKTIDFTRVREIVSSDPISDQRLADLLADVSLKKGEARDLLKRLEDDAENERPINWGMVEQFITTQKPKPPGSAHGTHVAGIIGADSEGGGKKTEYSSGVCPDIQLYDLRVLDKTLADTEFAIISALQYIRYVNGQHPHITIHGANLSLSIPHSVRNYACGRTPICNECERLVESGVVVVAAAGNHGYHKFRTDDGGIFESYSAFSITDPGNADGVITVGATHGHAPHTYGVSFFSSRGPTGDGRLKPDLVAPGERIQAPVLNNEWGQESGTSMAAPHVSGAAAMLMARYPELIGQPRRIKRILCESATDLGRERTFQGAGMLDVLRAFQSI
jgi:hypothetical protein